MAYTKSNTSVKKKVDLSVGEPIPGGLIGGDTGFLLEKNLRGKKTID